MMEKKGYNLWKNGERLFTRNMVPDKKVYGEKTVEKDGEELREWEVSRSKLGAAIIKDMPTDFLEKDLKALYLGAASGTTTSHVSDLCPEGMVFAVEYSHRVIPQLLKNVSERENVAPVLGDARTPEEFSGIVDTVKFVFQDVAQPDQLKIFKKNCEKFLEEDGVGVLAVKARSVSSSEQPEKVFKKYEKKLEQDYEIVWSNSLEPYEKDHKVFMVKK